MLNSTEIPLNIPIGSMYAIYGNIYHQYTPNVSIYIIHGSYGISGSRGRRPHDSHFWTPHFVPLNPPLKGGLKMQSVQVKSQVAWMKTPFFEVDLG